MDLAPIRALIALAEEHGLTELEVETEALSVRIVRPGPAIEALPAPAAAAPIATAHPASSTLSAITVKAPMAGTFYRAPGPDAEPFISVDQPVGAGAVLCIIESMKMMNEIKAPCAGTCVEVLVSDGTAIETGQPLFLLR